MKLCTMCGEEKELVEENFSKRGTRTDGSIIWDSRCKRCKSSISKKWRENNKERYLASLKSWRGSNPDYGKQYHKEYYYNHKSERIRKSVDWRKKNPTRGMIHVIQSKYKVNIQVIVDMMDDQRGACCICSKDLVTPESKTNYRIDHCHTTGKVRGLLCHNCNHLLGNSFDNEEILLSAIEYLNKHKENI